MVGGAVLGRRSRTGAHAQRLARARGAAASAARACSRPPRQPAPGEPRAARRSRSSAGAGRSASCSPSTSSAERARAVADERPGRDGRGGGGDLAVGDAQQHDVGAGAVRAAAERARHAEAGLAQCGRQRGAEAPATRRSPSGREGCRSCRSSSPGWRYRRDCWCREIYPAEFAVTPARRRQRAWLGSGHGDSCAAARGAQGGLARGARTARAAPLAETRTTVVFGAGDADADLMFVGEAPGANEDRAGPALRRPGGQAAGQAARRRSGWTAGRCSS